MSSSSSTSRGRWSDASWYWIWAVTGAILYELIMLAIGRAGGALSHVVWAALGPPFTWRWALAGAPLVGTLLWSLPHFLFQWGTGKDLALIVGGCLAVLSVAVLVHG